MIKHIISFSLILFTLAACAPTGIIAIPSSIADRRTTGVQVEDQTIEFKALYQFQKINGDFSVSATSYNQNVLITGESTTQELKDQIQDVIAKIEGVKSIYNEVLITSSLPLKEKAKSKTKDYGITTNIKARLFKEETKSNVSPVHIKVVTERQIVYLIGLVTQQEADEALQIAKTSQGVLKVKSFFEINNKYKKKREHRKKEKRPTYRNNPEHVIRVSASQRNAAHEACHDSCQEHILQ